MRDLLQSEFLHADNAEKRIVLARQLLELGEKAADDPVRRYAFYSLAREQAGRVGDPKLIEQVVDRLDKHYQIDALYVRAEIMAKAWRSDYSIPHRPTLFEASRKLLATAVGAENYAAAGQAMRVVTAGARAASDHRLLRELKELQRRIQASGAEAEH